MLACLSDSEIDYLLEEDVPYGDLTTHLLGIGAERGSIAFSTREETVLCCIEEVRQILEKLGCRLISSMTSGTLLPGGNEFLRAEGDVQALHAAWKVAVNLLEYGSGIATRTRAIVDSARSVNPSIAILTTRKQFPGTKKIAVKAITAGGALPHRLGLSESVLVFRQHTAFIGGLDGFLKTVPTLKTRAPETMIMVEAKSSCEAIRCARAGVDVLQLDKLSLETLAPLVETIRAINKRIRISAAGGINSDNAASYAATGVDILVLSSVYFGKPSDIAVTIMPSNTISQKENER